MTPDQTPAAAASPPQFPDHETTRRTRILDALAAFAAQRPGLEFGNYGDAKAYRAEMRSITRDLSHARALLRAVQLRGSISADDLISAARSAYSGRLTIKEGGYDAPGSRELVLEYCTGQYFPTEYRRAVCAVLASALWSYVREHAMPAPSGKVTIRRGRGPFATVSKHDSIEGLSPGDWLRRYFRREFGAAIARRWFN
jgi:hypothetical protein